MKTMKLEHAEPTHIPLGTNQPASGSIILHREVANPPSKSPSQSGYCSTNDGGKGQRNNGVDRDQNKPPPEECKAAEQYQSR